MKARNRTMVLFMVTLSMIIFLLPTAVMGEDLSIELGTADNFAVLAGSTITNTGETVITGDVGLSPGTSVTGFPPGIIIDGSEFTADPTAVQAKADLVTAYNAAAGRTETQVLTGQDLGEMTLTTGVYSFSTSAQLTGTLILDAQDDPDAVFIFKIGSTLTTASSSTVSLVNGARSCHVYWQVGSSATLGSGTNFAGIILALESITAETDATVEGQLLARNGAVTLDSNTITNVPCVESPTTGATTTPTTGVTPAPTTAGSSTGNEAIPNTGNSNNYVWYAIVLLGLAGGIALITRRRKVR